MRPRDEGKERSIRDQAIAMIVNEGFDGLSMQKLAAAVGVSASTIYIYYKNREDLLNKAFIQAQQLFADTALEGFDPSMSFEEGLWLQWQNRLRFIRTFPLHYRFYEQFRSSPLINHDDIEMQEFKANMQLFASNAVERGDIQKMEPELYWSMAYGPFYALVMFEMNKKMLMSTGFVITEERLEAVFDMVIKSFTPHTAHI